ncbi:MAG TPA: heme exporter protein CcmB [Gammaproteobacteria bacterium]|nr:heme exporter protein CcmB [Gammaproteobacteria bacterium]
MNQITMATAYIMLLRRDMILAYRNRAEFVNPPLFFVLVVSLLPLGIGPDSALLAKVAPGLVWVVALLATLLSLDSIFRSDFEDGALELLLVSPQPIAVLVLAKITAHWLVAGLPLLVFALPLSLMLYLPISALPVLIATLVLGTPVLSLLGAIGVALTVGLRRGGMLLALLVLPLYVPVLIFATSAVQAAATGLPVSGQLAIMSAMLILALILAPLTAAAALRISLN